MTYEVVGDEARVIGYYGDVSDVIIADTYMGRPVTTIAEAAFSSCKTLTSVVIPDGVIGIESRAFGLCTSLTNINIPGSVTNIEEQALFYCTSLLAIEVDDTNEHYKDIDGNLYSKDGTVLIQYATGKSDQSFTAPEDVITIENYAVGSSKLSNVVIGNNVTSIGKEAFRGSFGLTDVTIGDGVSSIDHTAFGECLSLLAIEVDENNEHYKGIDGNLYTKDGTVLIQYAIGKSTSSFTVPEGVTDIAVAAFDGANRVVVIRIPASVTDIVMDTFHGCSMLNYIEVDEGNQQYKDIDGNLYSKDGSVILKYAAGKSDLSFTTPSEVTTIADKAFYNCRHLQGIVIGDSVVSIGDQAFGWSHELTNIVIGDGMTSLDNSMFWGCDNVTNVVIGAGVTRIGGNLFLFSTNLASVEFKCKDGWHVGQTEIAVEDLEDTSLAAKYLGTVYKMPWTRE